MDHGLFGCIEGNRLPANIQSLNDTIRYVQGKSQKDNCILYHGFLSLSAEEVRAQEYRNRTKWKHLLAAKMPDLAKANGIRIQDFEWVAAYHMKKDQCHCHLLFWDKEQRIREPFVSKAVFEEKMEWVRGRFARVIFEEQFQALYQQQDASMKDMKASLHPFFGEFETLVRDMKPGELDSLTDKLSALSCDYSPEAPTEPRTTEKQLDTVAGAIFRVRDVIPKTGSLRYGYMPEAVRAEIDKAVLQIIGCHASSRSAYAEYLQTAEELRKLYANTPDSLRQAQDHARQTVCRAVGNMLLKEIRLLMQIERQHTSEQARRALLREMAGDIILQIAGLLSRGAYTNRARCRVRKDGLSRQAKKELAKQRSDKSLDWGQYEL